MRSLLAVVVGVGSGAGGCASRSTQLVGGGGGLAQQRVETLQVDSANVYLLPLPTEPGKFLLIDSGFTKNIAALEGQIRQAGFAPEGARFLVVTHGHYDHAGGARHFQERYGTKVIAGRGDQSMLAAGKHEPFCPTGFLGRQRLARDQAGTFPPLSADIWVEQPLPLGELTGIPGAILPLPGHTAGSLIVRLDSGPPAAGATAPATAVFVGDLLRGSVLGHGAELHLYMCDLAQNRRDINRLVLETAKDAAWFFPGHFGPLTRAAVVAKFGGK